MSLIPDSENIIRNKMPIGDEKGEIRAQGRKNNDHYFNHLSQEANELLKHLNKLANSYPFNVLYRYKDNMHDMR